MCVCVLFFLYVSCALALPDVIDDLGRKKIVRVWGEGFYITIQDELFTLGVNPMHGCRKILVRLDYGMCLNWILQGVAY